ncbi:unnamed protein product [Auanema sp. JU1783]|nr:unnamed protein product [Auanema sp. JU1783]
MRTHTATKIFSCPEINCSKSFISNDLLRRHLRNTHSNKDFNCNKCEKTYKSLTALKKHERIHDAIKRFVCEVCQLGFDISEQYKIHIRQHKQIQPYQCRICKKNFTSRSVCRRHRQTIHKDRNDDTNMEDDV